MMATPLLARVKYNECGGLIHMWLYLALLGGTLVVALSIGWWISRRREVTDADDDHEFRPPLISEWPGQQ